MLLYQGMVVLAGSQVWWTWEVEDVFNRVKKGDKLAMKNYAKKMHTQINDLVVKVGVIHYSHDSIFIHIRGEEKKIRPGKRQIPYFSVSDNVTWHPRLSANETFRAQNKD